MSGEAAYWQTATDRRVACELCPVGCVLGDGQDGQCGTRGNREGRMLPLQYGQVVATGLDPMEKKPLYHYLPGQPILSVAAKGCNLHCAFCQNWQISQTLHGRTDDLSPADVVALAKQHASVGIAFTYSEPLVWFEFVRDTARLAREAGLVNVVVTNGYLNPEPIAELIPLLDAANVDLKSMDDSFYREVCKGQLDPVLANIVALHEAGVHVEVTNLVIPGHNDTVDHFARLRDFVADLSVDIPLHLSAYRPEFRFDAPATPPATLERAAALCADRLRYVFTGNLHLPAWNNTRCPECGVSVIERRGYRTTVHLTTPECPSCSTPLPITLATG